MMLNAQSKQVWSGGEKNETHPTPSILDIYVKVEKLTINFNGSTQHGFSLRNEYKYIKIKILLYS